MRIRPLLLPFAIVASCADSDGAVDRPLAEAVWQVEPVVRMGGVDDPAQLLTRIGKVIIGPQLRLFVSQLDDLRVLVFDSSGALQASLGRPGRGPGEFQTVWSIGLVGDTLYASDVGLG